MELPERVLEGEAVGPTGYVFPLALQEATTVRWVGVTLALSIWAFVVIGEDMGETRERGEGQEGEEEEHTIAM